MGLAPLNPSYALSRWVPIPAIMRCGPYRACRGDAAMDMSVAMQPADGAAAAEASDARDRAPNSSDLDAGVVKVEQMGELKRITAEVDPDLEAATITYLVGSEKSPALLFEHIKGHPGHKALYNMVGCNLSRFCLMIGEKPVGHPLEAVQLLQRKMGRKMAPRH